MSFCMSMHRQQKVGVIGKYSSAGQNFSMARHLCSIFLRAGFSIRHSDSDLKNMPPLITSDAYLAHEKLARKLGFVFKELVTSSGEHIKEGIFHLQYVSACHSTLKGWLVGIFHSVTQSTYRTSGLTQGAECQ